MSNPTFNRMHVIMKEFHNHFRSQFAEIRSLSEGLQKDSLKRFSYSCRSFSNLLHLHHSIEESRVFPVLAQRMPEFKSSLTDDHKAIHDVMDRFISFTSQIDPSGKGTQTAELKALLDEVEQVLFSHLKAEEDALKGENMQKYWSSSEIEGLFARMGIY
eukprot:TRINITY_DN1710_c0_g1_i2.p1 TRINITY_DN1710_c0_g1~~TRINITY_DN1710_c0_g1_i2.p1  ORF type:complete len:159 (-),score=16.73 TRINITY_DN1710_c0_g1_i2:122-598(-)